MPIRGVTVPPAFPLVSGTHSGAATLASTNVTAEQEGAQARKSALAGDIAGGLAASLVALPQLDRHDLAKGEPVFLEGDAGDQLYLIARGAVSIKMRIGDEERARRVATFTPGVMFGEMALLEGKHRSADAFAKGDRVVMYTLSRTALDRIVREHPAIGSRIHLNLGRELAARLRATTEQLRALE